VPRIDLSSGGTAARARAWHHAAQAVVCDVLEPWAHGTIVRATPYPDYYDFNAIRVEDDPGMSVSAFLAFADQALAGLAHRRVDFEHVAAAEPLRAGFEAVGWRTTRLVWMHHEAPPPPRPDITVEEVPYEAAHELHLAWYAEDFPDHDPGDYFAQAREVAVRLGTRVLVVRNAGGPVALAQFERRHRSAEITAVYVHPEHRGRGLGTALTCAAIGAAGAVRDLWIVADDEGRAKQLYSRLGFRSAWTAIEALRLP
jgi:GNAT superfamily N-acetyltransferase